MKIGYQIPSRSTPSRVPVPHPHGAPSCRGRCYLPRIYSQFSSPLASFAYCRPRPSASPRVEFAVTSSPVPPTKAIQPSRAQRDKLVLQSNPTKSNQIQGKKFKQSTLPKMSQICVNLCNLWTILPPLHSSRPSRLIFQSIWVKPGQAQSRHNRVKTEEPMNKPNPAQRSPIPPNPAQSRHRSIYPTESDQFSTGVLEPWC